MRALEIITGHVMYIPAYTYKFQLKTTLDTIPKQAKKLGFVSIWFSFCAALFLLNRYLQFT